MEEPKKKLAAFRPRSRLLALEPRILFDGAAAVAAEQQAPQGDAAHNISQDVSQDVPLDGPAAPPVQTLAVVDSRLNNAAQLAAELGTHNNTRVVTIGQSDDGLAVIGQALAQQGRVDAIEIFSHGATGQVTLGNRVLSADNIAAASGELQSWSAHLGDNADILLYGCDTGAGAAGQALIEGLALATGADVAASSNDTGSADAGGDWVLEVATGRIEARLPVPGYEGLMANASPTVSLSDATVDTVLGDQLSFTATFTNASSQVGFAPFIDLILPVTGKDGEGAEVDDGITFVSATYLGQSVPALTVTFDADGNATHPLAKDASGAAIIVHAADYGARAGDQLVVLVLPYASVSQGQPAIDVEVTVQLSDLADTDGAPNLMILARGGFQFGNDSANNPSVDPSLVETGTHSLTVNPTVLTLTQSLNAPESETATGPNYSRSITVTATPAIDQTLTHVEITQPLPDNIRVTAITPGAGGTVSSVTLQDGNVVTDAAAINALLLQAPYLASYTVHYDTVTAAVTTTVTYYVPDVDASGTPILDPTTGADSTITIGAPTATGEWLPLDTRDQTPAEPPATGTVPSTFNATGEETSLTIDSITVRKSVELAIDSGSGDVSPGDTLQYTLNIDISDYFAIGRTLGGLNGGSLVVTDNLGDGLRLVAGSAMITFISEGTTGTPTVLVPTAGEPSAGGTALSFDLAQALLDQGETIGALVGDLRLDGTVQGATRAIITYQATVEEAYTTVYTQSEINEGDALGNDVAIAGTVLTGPVTIGGIADNTSGSSTSIPTHNITSSILDINGEPPPGSVELRPGDVVTFKLSYDLETGDYENFKLASYLPLPIFDLTGTTWTQGTGVGQWDYGSGNTNLDLVDTVTVGVGNSLVFDFGSYTTDSTSGSRIEVQFTLTVSDAPFPDQRPLTILSESAQETTISHSPLISSSAINIASVAEPVLDIRHGVVSVGAGSDGVVSGTTGTWVAAGGGGAPFTGSITESIAVDGNVTNIDAGDIVRLATAIENTGGLAAFDVTTDIALPTGLAFFGGDLASANIQVYRGDGTALELDTDYSISGNTITFLDAGGTGSLLEGRTGTANDLSGANVVVITYDVVAGAAVAASQNFETAATLTNYSSRDGGADFAPTDIVDKATEEIAAPAIVKYFADGSLTDSDSSAGHTTGADLVIGETMLYDIVVTLPEGVTQSLRVNDLVPDGMKLDLDFGTSGYQVITTMAGSGALAANFNGTVTTSSTSAGGDGTDLNLSFSGASVSGDNDAGNNSFVIRVRLIADNVAGNQAGTSRANGAELVYTDPDSDTPNGSIAVDRTVDPGSPAPVITVREPTLAIAQSVTTNGGELGVDRNDTVTYTITVTNNTGADDFNAYDINFSDALPVALDFSGDGFGLLSVTYGGGATNNGAADFTLSNGVLASVAGANIDVPKGGSITLVLAGRVSGDFSGSSNIVNNAEVRWTSLDGASGEERTGADGPLNVGSLNDYRVASTSSVPVAVGSSISHVGGLADTPTPSPTNNAENVAVGEIIYYRVGVSVPQGLVNDVGIVINLPEGLSFVTGADAKIALVSNGGLTSDAALSASSVAVAGSITEDGQTLLAGDLSNASSATLNSGLIDASDPRAIRVSLGTLTNADFDTDLEVVYLEFNVRVDNIAAVDTTRSLAVQADVYSNFHGTPLLEISTPVALENVVEPDLHNLQKTVTDFAPNTASTTGTATVELSFTNSGDGIAYDAHLTDSMTAGSNYTITSVVIGDTTYPLGNGLPAGVTVTGGSGITADFSTIGVGVAIRIIYTVDVPNDTAHAAMNAILNWSSLPETYTGSTGATVGSDGAADGERDGSGGNTAPNTYVVSEGAGLGIISGTLWDDTDSATDSATPDGPALAGQTVTLTWAGADGDIDTAGDNKTFTATTDANGAYHFGVLAAGTFRIDTPNPVNGYVFGADTDNPAARIDTDGGTLASVTVSALGEGASALADVGYVRDNDAPVLTVPGTQTTDEDTLLPILGISVADIDAGNADLSVQLSVLHGALGFTNTAGITVTAGAYNSKTVTIQGTQAALNAALATLQYTPDLDYNSGYQGDDTLTVSTSDLGHTGDFNGNGTPNESTDARTDSKAVTIQINPVNDLPQANADIATAIEAGGVNNGIPGFNPVGNVLQNDTDVDIQTNADVLTVTSIRLGTSGTDVAVSASTSLVGAYGTLTIDPQGNASYIVDNNNAAVQALRGAGNTLTESFTYAIRDIAGETSTALITVTLKGADDNPVGANDVGTANEAGGTLNAIGGSDATGNVLSNDTDVDAYGEARTVVGILPGQVFGPATGVPDGGSVTIDGSHGVLTLHADGSYTYVVNQDDADVQALNAGDTLPDYFTYVLADRDGATGNAVLRIDIQGANDAPVAADDTAIAVEAGGIANGTEGSNGTGNVLSNDTDVDGADTRAVTAVRTGTESGSGAAGAVGSALAGIYGSLTLNADGSYTYIVDDNNAAVQALRTSGETLSETFTYAVADASTATDRAQLVITIQGANDAPVAVDNVAIAVEAGGVANGTAGTNPAGNVLGNDADVDQGDSKTVTGYRTGTEAGSGTAVDTVGNALSGQYGSLVIAADGSASYVVDNNNAAVQALRRNTDTLVDTFTYTVSDAAGGTDLAQITVTIRGANDNPVAADDTATALEAGGIANGTAGSNGTGNVLANDTDVDSVDNGETTAVSAIRTGTEGGSGVSGTLGSALTGTYGSLTLNADGSYIYEIDNNNAAVQALRTNGQTLTDTFTYTVTDASTATDLAQLVITLQGANDTPVAADNLAIARAAGLLPGIDPTGNVLDNDADVDSVANGETREVTAFQNSDGDSGSFGTVLAGTYGSLTLNADGSYSYAVDNTNPAVIALGPLDSPLVETFDYTMSDALGTTSSATLTVRIFGANSIPAAVDDTATAVEAGGIANGTAGSNGTGNVLSNDADADAGQTATLTVTAVRTGTETGSGTEGSVNAVLVGTYGTLTLNSDGSYTYEVDNDNAAVQALRTAGDTLTDTFTYEVSDVIGATDRAELVVTIRGANDSPVAADDTATAVEAGGVANGTAGSDGSGNVLANDTDVDAVANGETIEVAPGVFVGTYGTLTLLADGSYTYAIDNDNTAVQALRTAGQTLSETFAYTVADALSATDQAQLVITIRGANDNPVAVDDTAVAVEAGGIANGSAGSPGTGNVLANDTDVDTVANGETKEVLTFANSLGVPGAVDGGALAGLYGSLTLATDGGYTYVVDNNNAAVQALRSSTDELTETFTYTMQDASGASSSATLTVTIQGANDAPLAADDAAIAVEAGGIANGTAGSNGTGNVLANDTDVDALANGETRSVSAIRTGTEAGSGITGTVGSALAGTYGSLTINADGSYSYVVDNDNAAVQALRTSGQTLTDTFTYTVADALSVTDLGQLVIIIRGANDNPVAIDNVAIAVEAGGVANGVAGTNPAGNVLGNDADVDAGDTKTVSAYRTGAETGGGTAVGTVGNALAGLYGSLVIAANGSASYVVDNNNAAVQALRTSDQTLTDTFTYRVTDTAGASDLAQITVTIQGANDNAVAVDDTAIAVEAGGIANGTAGSNGTGNVLANDTDVDTAANGETREVAAFTNSLAVAGAVDGGALAGLYGSLALAADGSYTYVLDNDNAAVQALRTSGQTLTDTFTYTVVDAAGATSTATLTVTVRGANDTPVAVDDLAIARATGLLSGIDPTGNVLDNDSDVDSVANGETREVTAFQNSGGDTGSFGTALAGTYGSLTLNTDGSYSYAVDNTNPAVIGLAPFDLPLVETFDYTMSDALGATSSATLTVRIFGANSIPAGVDDTATAVEAGGVANGTAGSPGTGNVLANDTDADAGQTATLSVTAVRTGTETGGGTEGSVNAALAGTYGTLTLNSDGSYTYVVDNTNATVQALRQSTDTLTETFTYAVTDVFGATDVAELVLTVQGANDNPVAADDTATAVEAGGVANGTAGSDGTGNVLTNDTDVDTAANGETLEVTPGVFVGTYGTLTLLADGSYTYVVDNANTAVQALRTNSQTLTDTFDYTAVDASAGTGIGQLVVTVRGANDAPVALDDTAIAVEAGGIANGSAGSDGTGNVLDNDTDVDSVANGETKEVLTFANSLGDSGAVDGGALAGLYGSLTLATDGSYSYVVDNNNSTVQALRLDTDTLTETFTYTMQDISGASSQATLTITIQGANDTPVAVDDTAVAVEAGGIANGTAGSDGTGNVLSNDADADAVANGDSRVVSAIRTGTEDGSGTAGTVGSALAGTYGTLTLNADGSYTYVIDNDNAVVQGLRTSGQTLTDTFTYTVADALATTDLGQLVITIEGANDNPVAVDDTATAFEAGGVLNGTPGFPGIGNVLLNDTDVDTVANGEIKKETAFQNSANTVGTFGTALTGLYGSLTLNDNGSYSYVIDNNNAAVQALRTIGQTLVDTFTYTMQDASGVTSSSTTLDITIRGANDNPEAVDDTAIAVEAGGIANGTAGSPGTGNVLTNDTDVDSVANGETRAVTAFQNSAASTGTLGAALAGTYGSLTLNADGSYTYVVDENNAAVQALRSGTDTLTETFAYTMQDAAGAASSATLTVTIQGANDNPVAVNDTAIAVEAGGIANGTAGSPGTGNVLANDTDVDSVSNGETRVVTAFQNSAAAPGSLGAALAGTYGSLTMNADGSYTYVIDNTNAAVQALRTIGQTLIDTFTYTMQDASGVTSSSATLDITIQGANDNPVAVDDTAIAVEAGGIANGTAGSPGTGNVLTNDTDVDSVANGETSVVTAFQNSAAAPGSLGAALAGTYGSLTMNADGSYTYAIDNDNAAVQALRTSGQTLTDTFTYTVTDATGASDLAQITVTIQGANDTPEAVDDAAIAVEAGGIANGTMGSNGTGNVLANDTDVDSVANGETKEVTTFANSLGVSGAVDGGPLAGLYGNLILAIDGSYTYVIDNDNAAVQALRLGTDTLSESFSYTMRDAGGATATAMLTVTIQGANDNPVALDDTAIAVEAGGIANGTAGSAGTGNVLTNDTDVDSMANGETSAVTAIRTGTETGSGTAGTLGSALAGTYGSLTLNADGSYTYVIDNDNAAVQALRTSGQTLTETFTYAVSDASSTMDQAQLVITIRGANDAPAAVDDRDTAWLAAGPIPGRNPSGNVLPNDIDVDAGDTATVTDIGTGGSSIPVAGGTNSTTGQSVAGTYGVLTIGADGSYSYILDSSNPAVIALRTISETLTETFDYAMRDTAGATSSASLTITIRGTDAAPIANNDVNLATDQVNPPIATGNVLLNDTDADANDTKTVSAIRTGSETGTGIEGTLGAILQGKYGALILNADGSYTYEIDLDNPEVQAAAGLGPVLNDIFTYTMRDSLGITDQAQLTIVLDLSAPNVDPLPLSDPYVGAGRALPAREIPVLGYEPIVFIGPEIDRDQAALSLIDRGTRGSKSWLTAWPEIHSVSIGAHLGLDDEAFVGRAVRESQNFSSYDASIVEARPGIVDLAAGGLLDDLSVFALPVDDLVAREADVENSPMARGRAPSFSEQLRESALRVRPLQAGIEHSGQTADRS